MLRAGLIALAALAAAPAVQAQAVIASATYDDPTTRYPHAVLGDAIEYGSLVLTMEDGEVRRVILPQERVFEDLEPRLHDMDGDGAPEVITVESHNRYGARLVIYGPEGEIAATPPIGTAFRWLAPVGVADFDGDGAMDVAYVDRPHLAKTLRIWTFRDGELLQIAEQPGLTNHRIGAPYIEGGVSTCGDTPAMYLADASWRQIVRVTWAPGRLLLEPQGPYEGRESLDAALGCS